MNRIRNGFYGRSITGLGLLIFRVGIALLMLLHHGIPKFTSLFDGNEIQFADPVGLGVKISFILAVIAEFLCSIFIICGLWTRISALILTINMAVAAFIFHSEMLFSEPPKQMATLFFFSFLLLCFLGGGRFSLNYLIYKRDRS